MPRDPEAAYQAAVDIDDSKKWRIRLNSIDEQASPFRDRRKDAMSLIHKFSVHDIETGAAVIDDNTGDMFEFWHFTHDGMKDKDDAIDPGREVANALCGKRLSHDEVRAMIAAGWSESLAGKTAIADLEWRTTKTGTDRLYILRMRPDTQAPRQRTAAPARPAEEAVMDEGRGVPEFLPKPESFATETAAERKARLIKELEAIG